MSTPTQLSPGIYGKLPSYGDFVTRRLPTRFLEPWDQWLQESIADSRDQLGARWLEIYLISPVWRFALSAGTAGQPPWAGLLMPSVDRVGRYFPLTLACPLPASSNPIDMVNASQAWYDPAEQLLLSCLDDEFDLAAFDRRLMELGAPPAAPAADNQYSGPWSARRMPLQGDIRKACPTLLHQSLGELFFAFSLWWTQGSDMVEPSVLVCQGLPPSRGFAAMLAGDWKRWGWTQYAEDASSRDRL